MLKSSFVAVFADREATAAGLTPLAISQMANTISCGKIGRLAIIWTVPKPGMTPSMTSTPAMAASARNVVGRAALTWRLGDHNLAKFLKEVRWQE